MFHAFFPRPRLFFASFAISALAAIIFWFNLGISLGAQLSLGGFIGFAYPQPLAANADQAAQTAFQTATVSADNVWFYQYLFVCYALFAGAWFFASGHLWRRWSVLGSALILFVTWFQVQLDVMINKWFGSFYDLVQQALSKPGSIEATAYYGQLQTFGNIAVTYVTVYVVLNFFTSHFVFRWRTAMNDRYAAMWQKIRQIEGASQRIQEDTMRFAQIVEDLGSSLIQSVMVLIAFLPILWGLSSHVKALPIIGEIPHALVIVAVVWSVFGTGLLALVGIRLPGLYFRNQRVEAAYRKELVLGEDNAERAASPILNTLFGDVRRNYFRLYFNYLYFNVVRSGYLQVGVLVPYAALGPTIIAAGFTLGIMQQIVRAFGRVETSFQYLVNSWSTIVELMSIYKRLAAFEAAINKLPLPAIDRDYQAGGMAEPGSE